MRKIIILLQGLIWQLTRHWQALAVLVIAGVWSLAWLAPTFMVLGWPAGGERIYALLRPHDHQLPQRSYFLYGQSGLVQSYSLETLLDLGADPDNLRAFVGNDTLGYKTAMNHRMMAIFSAMLLGSLAWPFIKYRLNVAYLSLLLLPMLVDAISHIRSENGSGWRQVNAWARGLSFNALPDAFYTGTTIGSLNWLLRTLTGFLFGLGLVLLLFLYMAQQFHAIRATLAPRLKSKAPK